MKAFSFQNLTNSDNYTNLSQSNVTQAIIDSSSQNILLPPNDYANFVKAVGYAGEGQAIWFGCTGSSCSVSGTCTNFEPFLPPIKI